MNPDNYSSTTLLENWHSRATSSTHRQARPWWLCPSTPLPTVVAVVVSAVFLLVSAQPAVAQSGSLDPSFDPGSGANAQVNAVAVAADGKTVVGGQFTQFAGINRNYVARLNADGTLDSSFDPGFGPNDWVFAVAIDANGKVLIGGQFTSVGGVSRNRIARLNADGTLDGTFEPGNAANNSVRSIVIDADGKILIGGFFTDYDGTSRNRIARLNATGTLDSSFDPGTGATGSVQSIAIDADGKIVIGGGFTEVDGTTRNRIARLNANGSLDTSLNSSNGSNDTIFSVAVDAAGKILIGGGFTEYDSMSRNRIARLNADGSLDTSFDPGTGATASVRSITIDAAGKIVIGGTFTSYDAVTRNRIARINSNGSLDNSFSPGLGASNSVLAIAIDADDQILIVGPFTSYAGTNRIRVARVNAGRGSTEFSAATSSVAENAGTATITVRRIGGSDGTLSATLAITGGTAVVGTDFTSPAGTRVPTFDASGGANDVIHHIAFDADGKILIAGEFAFYDGVIRLRIARIHSDGTLDTSFDPGVGPNGVVHAVAIDADGKILIGGEFTEYAGTSRNRIARLNADGTLDASFNPGTGANNDVMSHPCQHKISGGANDKIVSEISAVGGACPKVYTIPTHHTICKCL